MGIPQASTEGVLLVAEVDDVEWLVVMQQCMRRPVIALGS
jgi:hypothetical protein